jgi:alginate O-acetyltransferase complex protein AlgI
MLFTAPIFLFFFLPVVLIAHFCLSRQSRNVMLIVASLFFYASGEKFFVFVMVLSCAFNYVIPLFIDRSKGRRAGLLVAVAVTGNLALLVSYKYAGFLVSNLNRLLALSDVPLFAVPAIHLPIGISFFTFQAMSYVFDVYRGQASAQKNPINVVLYISMFPQLIAGPIVRYRDIASQIMHRVVTVEDVSYGIRRFIIGLGKKMIVANAVGEAADSIFAIPSEQLTPGLAWLGGICYTIQIYFDFSGYSDMAIGLGRMLGFRFLENFNFPYIAGSIHEFWRRWHISLSTWFRDYLYIPMGGNRVGPMRLYLNLLTVFFLVGLWHGASWNFVIWGLFHGLFLVIERLGIMSPVTSRKGPLKYIYTLLVVLVGWIFFRAETLKGAFSFLAVMAGFHSGSGIEYHVGLYLNPWVILAISVGIIYSYPIVPMGRLYLEKLYTDRVYARHIRVLYGVTELFVLGSIFVTSISLSAAGTYNPFIYFRF